MEFFAVAAAGTEAVLAEELRELGVGEIKAARGGVRFSGDWDVAWTVCLHSRIAQRVQVQLARFKAPAGEALYAGARAVDWVHYLTPQHTLAVAAVCRCSSLTHSGYVALKTKDAIVDVVRDRTGARPAVDRESPDVRVFVHLLNGVATIYLDLAGEPLHKRGYRTEAGTAPLRETLAAAMLRLSGWDRQQPLFDPLCGSGTLVIEAALWAGNTAPGLLRTRFGFERWASFDAAAAQCLAALRGQARLQAHGQAPRILGADCDPRMLDRARANARRAGVHVGFRQAAVGDLMEVAAHALVITNPPYGKRLLSDPSLYREMAAAFCRLHGHRVCVLAGTREIRRAIPLHPSAVHALFNGDIACEFLVYDVA